MRKRIIDRAATPSDLESGQDWLDLAQIATVEVTSEAPGHPVENVFSAQPNPGWRAAAPGEQVLRIVFEEPRAVERIQLKFSEGAVERTQEFTLGYRRDDAVAREIVRQQWTFSPHGSTSQVEDYHVKLSDVRTLELTLKPDLSPDRAVASLVSWRVA